MASSVCREDKPNPALCRLATQEGKMVLFCQLGITLCVSQEKIPRKQYNKFKMLHWLIASHLDLTPGQ